tara:strand:+ start:525 stop:1472 length:948 start_codon:yes stop_codon:yes gene_type:complete
MKKALLTIIIFCISITSKSQVQVDDINDAQAFLQEYLSPLGNGLGAITNNGWYNSAKPHRFLGFDATFTLSILNITDENKSFDPNSITNFSSNNTSTPTILGKGDGATANYKGEQFKLPNQSTLIPALVLPNFNFGLGVFKKTELNGRFIPNYKYNIGFFGKGEISMWGLGFKHDLLQWIPIIGNAIPMSLSLQAGHTQLNSGLSILDQDVSIDVQATNFNIILSRKILMLTGYTSVGYNFSTTTFTAGEDISNLDTFNLNELEISLPIEMKFENNNEFRANVGLRFNLAVIAIHANHTFSKYPVTTIGLGVSLR